MEREQLTRLLKVRLTNEEAELLKEVSPQMEVRRFLQLGLMAVESGDDKQGLARLRIILNALQLSPYTTLQHHTDAHRSASITATFRSCFFSQAWLFKLYHLLEQRGLIGEAERIMGREAADRFLQLGERGPNNRSFLFGLGHAYAALSFPESPDSITWKDYATAVFNDWVESGDCYEPGYVAHNIAFVIELGEVLGKVQQLRSPQCKQIFERYLAHISPSGLAIAPGDGDDQSSYVKAMEIIYRLTGDTAFHWGVTMAQAAGQYGGYRDSREARVIDPECVLPTTTIPANGVTRIQYLFSGKAHVPDRILLNPSRQLGKPYMGMMINDRYETLHHISEDNRGEIYHYEVDRTFGSGSSGVNVRDSGVFIELEFEYGQSINELFKYISTIKELISFMTYRRNVGFDKIEILLEPANDHIAPAIASVHIYNEEEPTDKHSFNCLSFTDIGEQIIPLIQLLHREDTGSPTYMLGFIPKNDRSHNIFTNTMVREVCSALECELGIRKELWPVEENVLKQLEKSVKNVVKEHRASNTMLPEKTYDLIFSSISRWSLTASDKILRLYDEYKDILFFRGCYLNEDKIASFVKYRNSITHGHYRVLSMEIAETTERLAMVVYCSIMDRLGISKDRIRELIRYKICS